MGNRDGFRGLNDPAGAKSPYVNQRGIQTNGGEGSAPSDTPRLFLDDGDVRLYLGDVVDVLRELPAESVHMACCSPPFYGLRDYGVPGQIGLEATPDEWVARLVEVFREVRRVLRADGTLWVEIGDSYNSLPRLSFGDQAQARQRGGEAGLDKVWHDWKPAPGCKPKDLIGAPWLLAFALRADGWYLRSEIIWSKPNPMPESVSDRPTTSHSRVFLLSKSARYFYDAEAIREPHVRLWDADAPNGSITARTREAQGIAPNPAGRNRRSVWTIATQPYPEAHFATWPEKLVEPMILAGTSERGVCPECGAPWERVVESVGGSTGQSWHDHSTDATSGNFKRLGKDVRASEGFADYVRQTLGWQPLCTCVGEGPTAGTRAQTSPATVLDPFCGSGTTMHVARRLGRRSIGVDLSSEYLELAAKRLAQQSLLAAVPYEPPPRLQQHRGLTGGAYSPPGQSPHSNARVRKGEDA